MNEYVNDAYANWNNKLPNTLSAYENITWVEPYIEELYLYYDAFQEGY